MLVLLPLEETRALTEVMCFIIPILQLRKQDAEVKILEILFLGLVSVEAGLEILLVVCTCVGVSLPNTALHKCLPLKASPGGGFLGKRAITTCLLSAQHIVLCL